MTGTQIFERFCNELKAKNLTRQDFCAATGINQGALSNWKRRGTMPSSEMVIAMSEYLGCSTDYILGKSDVFQIDPNNEPIYSEDESKLIDAYRNADEKERRMIIEMLAFFKSQKQD